MTNKWTMLATFPLLSMLACGGGGSFAELSTNTLDVPDATIVDMADVRADVHAEVSSDAKADTPVQTGDSAENSVTGTAADPNQSTVRVDRATGVVADGVDYAIVTITAIDSDGAPIPGATVSISAAGTGNLITQAAVPTDTNGVAVARISSTVAEAKRITAVVTSDSNEVTLTQQPLITFSPGPAAKLAFVVQPSDALAGAVLSPTVKVAVQDANGNQVQATNTITLALADTPANGTLSGTTSVSAVSGVAYFDTLSVHRAGSHVVAANTPGLTSATSETFTIAVNVPSPTISTVAAEPAAGVVADGTAYSTVTVTIMDAYENPVVGALVVLSATGTENTIVQPPATDENGVASGTIVSTTVESKVVTATVGGTQELSQHPTIAFVVGPPSNTHSTLVANPTTLVAYGGATTTLTVTVKDAQNRPRQDQAVSLTSSGTANTFTPVAASGTTNASGVFTATLSSTYAETKTITATIGALELTTPVIFHPRPFVNAGSFTVGADPKSVVAADFNSDSYLDLAVVNSGSNTVSILLNDPDSPGTFLAKVDYAVGNWPWSQVAADFNNDGYIDLAVSNFSSDTVSVFLNNPDSPGTFQPKVDLATTVDPGGLAAAHFNDDAFIDLAIASYYYDAVWPYFNNSGTPGTFNYGGATTAGPQPVDMTAADFNNDTFADLAVINTNSLDGHDVSILLRDTSPEAERTFLPAVYYSTGRWAYAVSAADFNDDTFIDLVVTNETSSSVTVFLNNSLIPGTFLAGVSYSGGGSYGVATADFNGDGYVDFAVSGRFGTMNVFLNNPDQPGTFLAKSDYSAGSEQFGLAAADFNDDGLVDLAVADKGGDAVIIFLNSGYW